MDGFQFDALARSLTTAGSRRRAFTGLLSGTLGLVLAASSMEDVAAKKKCPPCQKRKKGKCKKAPNETACSGGTCQNGNCVAAATRVAAATPCVPTCGPKSCGDNGCGGSCGACTGGTCTDATCTCPPTAVPCGGDCIDLCFGGTILDQDACTCCILNNENEGCAVDGDCCSGQCVNDPSQGLICVGRGEGAACRFHAQCASLNCTDGVCRCSNGRSPCGNGRCSDFCESDAILRPGSCHCCQRNGASCLNDLDCCAQGTEGGSCQDAHCAGRLGCAPCTFGAQCALEVCVGGQCGDPSTTFCPA